MCGVQGATWLDQLEQVIAKVRATLFRIGVDSPGHKGVLRLEGPWILSEGVSATAMALHASLLPEPSLLPYPSQIPKVNLKQFLVD